jgi:hypothetical protein
MKHFQALIILLAALLVSSCSALSGRPVINAAQPTAGKATVTAQIISTVTNQPLADTMIRLAPINRDLVDNQPIFILNESASPGARTDANGNVVIANVEPQEYVMIVSSDMGDNSVVLDGPDTAKIWLLERDKILEIGQVRVEYP